MNNSRSWFKTSNSFKTFGNTESGWHSITVYRFESVMVSAIWYIFSGTCLLIHLNSNRRASMDTVNVNIWYSSSIISYHWCWQFLTGEHVYMFVIPIRWVVHLLSLSWSIRSFLVFFDKLYRLTDSFFPLETSTAQFVPGIFCSSPLLLQHTLVFWVPVLMLLCVNLSQHIVFIMGMRLPCWIWAILRRIWAIDFCSSFFLSKRVWAEVQALFHCRVYMPSNLFRFLGNSSLVFSIWVLVLWMAWCKFKVVWFSFSIRSSKSRKRSS